MSSMASSPVDIQTSPESVLSPPPWLAEVTIVAHYLTHLGRLEQIAERVQFARARFGIYDVIDFVAVLMGYALSGERTLESFYERLRPFAVPFMALFGREQLPSHSALSRFLAALDQPTIEVLRSLFQEDLLSRPLTPEEEDQAGLQDRCGQAWKVFDSDGTRQAARQRALPHSNERPSAHRRMGNVCAAGYTGRKRGEVVRTRTTLLLAHTQQWFATLGNAGNGEYRGELLRVIEVLRQYAAKQNLDLAHIILRLDGQYGDVAVVIDLVVSGLCFVTRGKDYGLLDLPAIQARLQRPPDEMVTHPETGTCRALFDCPAIPLPGTALTMRVLVATHQASTSPASVGMTRDGVVYELFFTALPQEAFSAADVLMLYLQRGAFETVLSDEDTEQDPDRWVSYSHWGQECWQIVSQWMWNLRLELGHCLHPTSVRLTELAPAFPFVQSSSEESGLDGQDHPDWQTGEKPDHSGNGGEGLDLSDQAGQMHDPSEKPAAVIYGPPELAPTPRAGKFAATDFEPQPDGTLRCPAGQPLYAEARRPERNETVRVLYAARLPACRGCPLRLHCQAEGTKGPRRVSAVIRPMEGPAPPPPRPCELPAPTQPILWREGSGRQTRRTFIRLLHTQTVTITHTPGSCAQDDPPAPVPLTREQRAHWRLSWAQRFSRNAHSPLAPSIHLHLFGIPTAFARFLGLPAAA
jgi:plasmid stabilization system protein ParE